VKYMILLYGSQQDYDAMSGRPSEKPSWTAQDFAAMGQFMEAFNKGLADSGELVETRGLTVPVHARRIQLHDGVLVRHGWSICRDARGSGWLLDHRLRELRVGNRNCGRALEVPVRRTLHAGHPSTLDLMTLTLGLP